MTNHDTRFGPQDLSRATRQKLDLVARTPAGPSRTTGAGVVIVAIGCTLMMRGMEATAAETVRESG